MNRLSLLISCLAVVQLAAAGCNSSPENIPELNAARAIVNKLDANPMAGKVALDEVQAAHAALARAEDIRNRGGERKQVQYHAYIATRNAEIAMQRLAESQARNLP